MIEDRIEGIQGHHGQFIYGSRQNPNHIHDKEDIRSVDSTGKLVKKKMPTDEQLICNFWAKQQNKKTIYFHFFNPNFI